MKKIIGALAIYATLALLAAPAFANVIELNTQTQKATPAATPAAAPAAAAPAQGPCTDDAKAAWYADFTKYRTTDAAKAYDAAKKYLAACPTEEGQIPAYLKKWVAAYDKEARKLKLTPMLYGEKKYPEALSLAKEILTEEPDNLRVIVDLGYGSYLAAATLKQDSYNADALTYMRKAIQMIEAGKAPDPWTPFKGKDDTLAYLYNSVGRITLKTDPGEALKSLIKAVSFETDLKKDPWSYFFIAAAYETGPYVKLSADYKKRFEGQNESPESKLALANVTQVIERMVDAYARAVSLAGSDAKYATNKKDWLESLTTWYKYLHNQSDVGLNDLIAGVLAKPLPPEPTPLTTLPESPATTTTPSNGSTSSAGSTTGASTQPAPSSFTTTPKTTTPAATTTKAPEKPKTRNNHNRH
jgi:tetratricopeptide (TPR) repeat protein